MPQLKRAFFAAHPLDGLLLSLSLGYAAVRRFQEGASMGELREFFGNGPFPGGRPEKRAGCHEDALKDHEAWRIFFRRVSFWFCSKGGNGQNAKRGWRTCKWKSLLKDDTTSCGWWFWFPHFYVHNYMSRLRHSQLSWKNLAWVEGLIQVIQVCQVCHSFTSDEFPVAYNYSVKGVVFVIIEDLYLHSFTSESWIQVYDSVWFRWRNNQNDRNAFQPHPSSKRIQKVASLLRVVP